jgi:hypothetical protein
MNLTKRRGDKMKNTILLLAVVLFFFSGILPGAVCTITKPLGMEIGSDFNSIILESVAWAQDDGDDDDDDDDDDDGNNRRRRRRISVPEPSTFLLLGVGIGAVALLRKKFKK